MAKGTRGPEDFHARNLSEHPPTCDNEMDPNPTWLGYSVGRWDGSALVVDSSGFNGRIWLDTPGHPATDALRIRERFERPDYGHLVLQLSIDDPQAYTTS